MARSSTTFEKGNSVGKGKPKLSEKKIEKERSKVLWEILREAQGDPVRIMELKLLRGAELYLNMQEVDRLCKELAPYKSSKKASTEGDIGGTTYLINYGDDSQNT